MREALFLILSALAVMSAFACSPSADKMDSIVVAEAQFESIALHWIAEDQQFFRRNGLNVTSHKHSSGVGALDALVKGEAVIAVGTSEFPLVERTFLKERIRSIASIAKSDLIYLIGRKDRGIEKVSDLKGKRVGTTLRTIAHFCLGRFLEIHGMSIQDIIMVDLRTPAEWLNAIVDGDIDAVATAQPYADSIKDRLGANASFWSAQSSQSLYAQAISTDEWVTRRPELVVRFLKALALAEGYLIRHPGEAKAIIQTRLNLDAAYLETVWSQNQYSLSLDQSLIIAMEDEARWMISNGLTGDQQVPDFLNYIYEDGLKTIKPEAVTIVR